MEKQITLVKQIVLILGDTHYIDNFQYNFHQYTFKMIDDLKIFLNAFFVSNSYLKLKSTSLLLVGILSYHT